MASRNSHLNLDEQSQSTYSAGRWSPGSQSNNDEDGNLSNEISSGGRFVRLMIHGGVSSENRIWIDQQATFSDISTELATIDSTGEFVVLQPMWGPKPHWTRATPELPVGKTCRIIHAVFSNQAERCIAGVVRTSLSDYPIVISESEVPSSTTFSQALESLADLTGKIKSITRYSDDKDVSNDQINYEDLAGYSSSTFSTTIIVTIDQPTDEFQSDPAYEPVPAFLQVTLIHCTRLLKRSYDLKICALQMIHLSHAMLHIIISLANQLEPIVNNENPDIEAALAADSDTADMLRMAPFISRDIRGLLDMVDEIMNAIEYESLNRGAVQCAVREAFNAICGDYPGAVTVRHSHKRFETFALIDWEEEVQAHDGPNHMGSKITHTDIQTGDDAGYEGKLIPKTGQAIGGMRESVEGAMEGSNQNNNNKISSEEPVATRGEETSTSTSANAAALTSMAVSKYLSPSVLFGKLHSAFDRVRNAISSTVSGRSEVSGSLKAVPEVFVNKALAFFALIIGIDEYKYKDFAPLKCAVADARAIKDYLETSLGVPTSQIKTLFNKEATRDAIIASLRDLATNNSINRGDPILIYYAGHGSRSKAPAAWESGGYDIQVLVSHDTLCEPETNKVFGIPDRTMGVLLEEIAQKKDDNITVILDCSHSGSMTGRALRSHVLLSACGAEESVRERGYFTKQLLNTLQSVGADKLTYADLVQQIHIPGQNPQCEGFNQDRICFDAKAPVRSSRMYPVRKVDQEYIIEVGTMHGISDGAIFAIYNDRAVVSTQPPVTKLAASKPKAFSTNLIPLPDTREFDISERAVGLLIRPGKEEHLRIYIGMDKKLKRIFQELSDETQIDDPERSTFILVEKEAAELSVAFDGDHVVFNILDPLVTVHGFNRMPFSIPSSPTAINSVIGKAARYFWHLRRTGSAEVLQGTVSMEVTKLEELEECDEDLCPIRRPSTPNPINNGVVDIVFEEDAIYGIKLTNKWNKPLYTSLFYFDNSDLSITSCFEPATSPGKVDPSLRPYGTLTLGYGSGGVPPFEFSLREGQDVDVGFLKLFISTEPVDLSPISQLSPFSGAGRGIRQRDRDPVGAWSTLMVTVVQRRGPST